MRSSLLTNALPRRRTLLACALLVPLTSALSAELTAYTREPISPLPLTVTEDLARAQLGERLFRDARLSRDQMRSCATCHPLDAAGMDGAARAHAFDNVKVLRNTPSIFNLRYDLFFNWDGATESLPVHDAKVLTSPALMALEWPELLARLRDDAAYRAGFKHAYQSGGLTKDTVLDALATFERTLITPNARFDRYLRGELAAISSAERQGYGLFKSYGCVACHQGTNIGGNLVQKFGVFEDPDLGPACKDADSGRFKITSDPLDMRVFRVPSLRNVAMTAPYFHNGCAATLEVAVNTMARVQLGRPIRAEDARLIIQFLKTLTGEYRGHPVVGAVAAVQR